MKEYLPILITLIGAGVGAFFAFVKTKTEKRWAERYDAFSSIVYSASVIRDCYEILKTEADVNGYRNVVSEKEWDVLHKELIESKMSLRRQISKLQLLVKPKNFVKLGEAHDKLVKSFERLSLSGPQEYVQDYMVDVIDEAKNVISVAVVTSQLKFI